MARKRGTYSLSANIEMLAGAPIDARSVVATKADLTANGSFPYPYIGMETYVVSENKKYKLIADDATDSASWQELNTVSGLSDTSISSIADGNALEYDATAQKWKNVPKKAEDAIQKYTYSISDHGILAVGTTGQTDTISSGIDKLRTITIQAIADHVTWINGAIPPAPPANYTYTISDHDLLVAAAAPATDTITDWVGKIHTALTGIISDHKTWIDSFLPLSGGTMTGLLTLSSSGYTVNNEAGYSVNQYGNFNHKRSNATDYWTIASYDSGIMFRYYYDTGVLNVDKLKLNKSSNQLLTGTGTAGQDKGSGQTNRYVPSVWTFNKAITPEDGDEIMIKIPVAGISYGVWLTVDNGTTYYPVGRNDTSRLQTQFANGTTIHLVFQTNANMSMYARGGADSSTTYTGNYWKVVNYYDTNTTYSVVSTSANGLAPKVTDTSMFLKGDGTWATPSDTKVTVTNTNPASITTHYPVWYTATSGTGGVCANDGFRYNTLQGTASAVGYANIDLGNATSTGTAGNKAGTLSLYSEKSGYVALRATASSTTGRSIYFPDKAGTVALTSDLSGYLPLSGGTMTGGPIILPASDTTGVIRPASNNYGQIGTSDYSFYNAYIYEIHVSSLCGIKNKTYINCYASLIPDTATTSRVLGSYDKPWYGLYTNGNIAVYKPSNIEWSLNGTNGEPSIIMNAANDKAFKFKYTSYGTNIDVGWDWNNVDGSGAFFRSVDSTLTAGSCGLYARSTSSNTTQITLNPGGDIVMEGTVRPNVNVTRDLGTSSYKFRYIYGHCASNSTSNADYTSVTGYSEILGGVRHVYLKGTTTRAISSTYGNLKYSSTTMPIPSSLGWSVSGLYMVLSATVQAASGLNFCSVFSVTASSIGIFITAAQAESSKAYTVWVHLICAY
ncbi:MAG: hypothetical protein J6Y02_00955 [Pseudobutyrivibrio sp.]|nr:hypothetical protein [Pseudobutyrivibrio sp.]